MFLSRMPSGDFIARVRSAAGDAARVVVAAARLAAVLERRLDAHARRLAGVFLRRARSLARRLAGYVRRGVGAAARHAAEDREKVGADGAHEGRNLHALAPIRTLG